MPHFLTGWVGSGLGSIRKVGEVGHHYNRFCSLPSAPQQLCSEGASRGPAGGRTSIYDSTVFRCFSAEFHEIW